MWAHSTLIYPFRATARIDAETVQAIESVLASFGSFDFTLTTVEYFRSPRVVLYLAPEPATPFKERGVFDEFVPHVQVADEKEAETLAAIEVDVRPHLPIRATAEEVQLVEHAPEGWRGRQSFKLANTD
jgi:2'-5' RNA ligase